VRARTSSALEPMQALLRDPLRLEPRRSAVARPPLLLRQPPRALREGKPLRLRPAPTGASAGSHSFAVRLQKEWANTASSAGSGEAGAKTLTLKELSKQLATIRELLWNAGLQFVEAEKTVDVSNSFPNIGFFCRLQCGAGYAIRRLSARAGRSGTDSSSY
jgi:hypothetical protein